MRVDALSSDLSAQLAGRDLIVFDGECVFCSHFFQFVVKRDTEHRFSFATAQSALGQDLYAQLGLPTESFETNLVIVDGHIYQRLDAACAAVRQFSLLWRALALARFLPRWIKDPAYHLIARNRYRLFGRYDRCMVPSVDLKHRFID